MRTTCILALIALMLMTAIPVYAGTTPQEDEFPNYAAAVPTQTDTSDEAGDRGAVGDTAAAVEKTTDLTAVTCGIAPANGLAAIPCIAAQGINLLSAGVSWLFGK